MTKVDELQEELNARIKERSSHGKTFDEIDLIEMEQNCKITGMHFCRNDTHQRYFISFSIELKYADVHRFFIILDKPLLVKSGVVLCFVMLLFFLQNIPSLNLSLGWTSLIGAITLLILQVRCFEIFNFDTLKFKTIIFLSLTFSMYKCRLSLIG